MAKILIEEIIEFFSQPQFRLAEIIAILYWDEMKKTAKYIINLVLERKSSDKWQIEQMELPINIQYVNHSFKKGNEQDKNSLSMSGRTVTKEEKQNLDSIIELMKNEDWGYITLVEPSGKITYCKIIEINKLNLELNNVQPYSIKFEILGTDKTHSQGYSITDLRKLPNHWNI